MRTGNDGLASYGYHEFESQQHSGNRRMLRIDQAPRSVDAQHDELSRTRARCNPLFH